MWSGVGWCSCGGGANQLIPLVATIHILSFLPSLMAHFYDQAHGGGATMRIGDIHLGKVDGKFEYITSTKKDAKSFYNAFLIPDNVDINSIGNHDRYFISGFRGTGKTSLLRWFAHQRREAGSATEFILFKSDIPEDQRLGLSTEVGYSIQEADSRKMEFSQDFKTAWSWFIVHKISQILYKDGSYSDNRNALRLFRLAGISNNSFKKALGFLPKLKGLNFNISADLDFFSAELGADFEKNGAVATANLPSLVARGLEIIDSITLSRPVYILFDELEVFYDEVSKYRRDQRMVRDLLFTISKYNDHFSEIEVPVHIIAAVRSEVVDGLGPIGQEVERIVHDKGTRIAWHFARRSLNHPLFEIISNKIKVSDNSCADLSSDEIISNYFPLLVRGEYIDEYLLDRSFYRPRDMIWRLTIVQQQFPGEETFTEQVLLDTEGEYSSQMWDEITYELSAKYSDEDIQVIEMLLSGSSVTFDLADIESKSNRLMLQSESIKKLLSRFGVIDILQDLYRLGAIGNYFRVGSSGADIRNRWAFRGDPTLLPDKRMTINPSLEKRLSTVRPRRRGSRGSGRSAAEDTDFLDE